MINFNILDVLYWDKKKFGGNKIMVEIGSRSLALVKPASGDKKYSVKLV